MKGKLYIVGLSFFMLLISYQAAQATSRLFFTPSLSVSEEYTDNLFLTDGDEESEFITVVSPGVALDLTSRRSVLSLFYSPGFSFYREYDDLNSIRHRASLDGSRDLSQRLTFSVSDNFVKTEEPYTRVDVPLWPEEVVVEDFVDYTLRSEREPRYINNAQARMDYRFGRMDTVYAEYNHFLHLDDNTWSQNSQRHNPGAGFEVWPTLRNGLSGSAYYTRGLFEEEFSDFSSVDGNLRYTRNLNSDWAAFAEYTHLYTVFDEDSRNSYNVYNPATGIIYNFADDATLEVGAGYYYLLREDDSSESGATANVAMEKAWRFRRGAFRITGGSGYEQTYFRTENLGFTEYYEAGAALEYSLTRYLVSSLGGNYRFNRYLDQEVDPEREDHIASATAGLTYPLTRWLDVSLSGTHRLVETNQENELRTDYRENSVVLSLTATAESMLLTR